MKKQFSILVLTLLFSVVTIACGEKHPITINELPTAAQTFIKTHFAALTTTTIFQEHDSYDVHFSNGYEVEFDKKGNWEDVDCNTDEVPAAIIPEAIRNYVTAHYANNFIVEISKDKKKYDIELNNGVDLEFDQAGNFLRIDN